MPEASSTPSCLMLADWHGGRRTGRNTSQQSPDHHREGAGGGQITPSPTASGDNARFGWFTEHLVNDDDHRADADADLDRLQSTLFCSTPCANAEISPAWGAGNG